MSITSLPEPLTTGTTGATGPTGPTGATGPAGTSLWTTLSKSADQTVSLNNSVQNDNDLFFAVAANTKYRIRGFLVCEPIGASDWKYEFNVPTFALIRVLIWHATSQGGPVFFGVGTPSLQGQTISTNLASISDGRSFVELDAILHNGATAGTFQVKFAQDTYTSDAAPVLKAGSYIEWAVA